MLELPSLLDQLGGPGPCRASVPSSNEGLGYPIRFLPPGEGRNSVALQGRRGPGSGSPSLRPGSPRRFGHRVA